MAEPTDNRLRLLFERIERIDQEIAGLRDDRRDIFAEAKAVGYDTATMRIVLARRKMSPADRDEADAMVETYEAALGGSAPDPAVPPAEAQRIMAETLLAEQLEAIEDPVAADNLVEHISIILDIRAEIALLRDQEKARLKLAKSEGWVTKQVSATVRWIEKCAKHGRDAMRAAELVFHQYRGTVDARGLAASAPASDDPTLQKLSKPGAADPKMDKAAAWVGLGELG